MSNAILVKHNGCTQQPSTLRLESQAVAYPVAKPRPSVYVFIYNCRCRFTQICSAVGVSLFKFAKPTPKICENRWFSVKKWGKTSVFGVGFRCQVLVSVSVSLSSLDRQSRFGPKIQNPVPVPVVNRDRFCHWSQDLVYTWTQVGRRQPRPNDVSLARLLLPITTWDWRWGAPQPLQEEYTEAQNQGTN
jgi:hypothetical protein